MNRVKTTTTTAGQGNITTSAVAAARCRPLSDIPVGRSVAMMIEDEAGTDWELSLCTILSATTFSRDTVLNGSSGPGVKVNFGAGTKSVFFTMSAEQIAQVSDVPFSEAVPLGRAGTAYMTPQTVAGPLTFTAAAGAVRGALAYLRLTADGVNAPSFAAFKEWGGSSGYDNRNGIVNELQFFYDGYDLFYTASQEVGAAPIAPPDTLAPTLTSPTSASTGATTGSGSVTTNEGNGTLYYLATTNATETAATVKASGATLAIASTGSKAVTVAGLTPSTAYCLHFVHRDAAGNDSTRVSSASFTTAAAGDTTAPTLSAPTGTQTGSTTASGSVTTNEANGTLYRMASINAVESAATVKAAALTTPVAATGAQAVTFTGLTASTVYYAHYVHRDAAGNDSLVANSASFTTAAQAASPRMTVIARALESGTGPYQYSGSGSNGFGESPGEGQTVCTKYLPAGGDGSMTIRIDTVGAVNTDEAFFGLDDSSSGQGYATIQYGFVGHTNAYESYASATMTGSVTPGGAVGDYLRIGRVGTTITAEFSKDQGATWTTVKQWTGVPTTVMYFHGLLVKNGKFTPISTSGLV